MNLWILVGEIQLTAKIVQQSKTLRCIADFKDTLTTTARATPTAAG